MKINKLLFLGLLGVLTACGGQDEPYKDLIEGGPIVYLQRYDAEEIVVQAGRERVQITLPPIQDPRIDYVLTTWANATYEKKVPVIYGQPTVFTIDENVPEGLYDFILSNRTEDGLFSLSSSVDAETFGDIYESYLFPRNISRIEVDLNTNSIDLQFSILRDSTIQGTEIEWEGGSEYFPNTEENIIHLTNFPINEEKVGEFQYRTHVLPQPNAIDKFYSGWKNIRFQVVEEYLPKYLDRQNWTFQLSYPNLVEGTNGPPSQMIDGNNSSFFAIRKPGFNEVPAGTESFFIVDMQEEQTFDRILWRHRDAAVTLRAWGISLFGSNDGENFTEIAENLTIPGESDTKILDGLVIFNESTYRYLKVQFTRWNTTTSTAMQVAEFNVGLTKGIPTGNGVGEVL